MPDVHINVADVERLRRELKTAKTQVDAAVKKVDNALRGADWNDPNRRAFEEQLSTAKRSASRFGTDADQMDRFLGKVIDQARRMKLG